MIAFGSQNSISNGLFPVPDPSTSLWLANSTASISCQQPKKPVTTASPKAAAAPELGSSHDSWLFKQQQLPKKKSSQERMWLSSSEEVSSADPSCAPKEIWLQKHIEENENEMVRNNSCNSNMWLSSGNYDAAGPKDSWLLGCKNMTGSTTSCSSSSLNPAMENLNIWISSNEESSEHQSNNGNNNLDYDWKSNESGSKSQILDEINKNELMWLSSASSASSSSVVPGRIGMSNSGSNKDWLSSHTSSHGISQGFFESPRDVAAASMQDLLASAAEDIVEQDREAFEDDSSIVILDEDNLSEFDLDFVQKSREEDSMGFWLL